MQVAGYDSVINSAEVTMGSLNAVWTVTHLKSWAFINRHSHAIQTYHPTVVYLNCSLSNNFPDEDVSLITNV